MVAKVQIEYKLPLISGDKFIIGINIKRQGAKLLFIQDIYRLSDGKLCTKGIVETICIQNGRLTRGEIFDKMFAKYLISE
jgi:acyl-CoA thioester hydrolase